MNISGIRPYAGFYDYNSIKAEELRSRQIAEAQLTISLQQPKEPQVTVTEVPVEQNFDSYDFAQTYRPARIRFFNSISISSEAAMRSQRRRMKLRSRICAPEKIFHCNTYCNVLME